MTNTMIKGYPNNTMKKTIFPTLIRYDPENIEPEDTVMMGNVNTLQNAGVAYDMIEKYTPSILIEKGD